MREEVIKDATTVVKDDEDGRWSANLKRYKQKKKELKQQLVAYLLRRDVERDGTEINFAVSIDTRNDEEDTGASGSAFEQTTQAENNGSFVFLYHLAAWIIKEPKLWWYNRYFESHEMASTTTDPHTQLGTWLLVRGEIYIQEK